MINPISNKPMTKKLIPPKLLDFKKEHPFASIKESSMRAPGGDKSEKDRVFKYGQMVLDMKDSGQTTKQTEKESSFMWMETFTKVTGRMTKLLVLALIIITMVPSTLENGLMIYNTEKVWKRGLMGASTKDNITWVKKMGKASISGKMAASTMVIGSIIKLQVLEDISGQMAEDMKANG